MVKFAYHPKLSMPPVQQVAFVVIPASKWDLDTIKDSIIERHLKSFPKKQSRKKVGFSKTEGGDLETIETLPPDDQPHFRLSNDHSSIAIGPQYFSYMIDETYSGWKDYSALISELISMFYDFGNSEFKFISLKYNNEIEVKKDVEDVLNDWLIPTKIPFDDADSPFAFKSETVSNFSDGIHRIEIDYPSRFEDSEDGFAEFVSISIDHSFIPSEDDMQIGLEDLIEWIEIAHERIFATFNISLTESTMEQIK